MLFIKKQRDGKSEIKIRLFYRLKKFKNVASIIKSGMISIKLRCMYYACIRVHLLRKIKPDIMCITTREMDSHWWYTVARGQFKKEVTLLLYYIYVFDTSQTKKGGICIVSINVCSSLPLLVFHPSHQSSAHNTALILRSFTTHRYSFFFILLLILLLLSSCC